MAQTPLQRLSDLGQSVWIDYLSRSLINDGDLEQMMDRDAVVGVTTNPTIFQKAMAEGDAYDAQLKNVLAKESDDTEVFFNIATTDVSDACDLLRPVWDEGGGRDGYVSIEVTPDLAYDTDGTIAQAQRLHEWIDKPNLFVKIPATEAGLPAIEEMIARGRSINVTLIFSLERYRKVTEAYVRGIERLVESGGDPSTVASVASFFVSRVDTEIDKRLEKLGGHDELLGKGAIANAKIAYEIYKEVFAGNRWDKLAAKGAAPQRCLWASTSTKNPKYRDVLYVEELIGQHTVNTMPEETIRDFQAHGEVRGRTVEEDIEGAHRTLDALGEAGVDYDDVTATVEREGVEKFSDSFDELLQEVGHKRDTLVAA
jgi:transaldolase